jgi:hypothetical protein
MTRTIARFHARLLLTVATALTMVLGVAAAPAHAAVPAGCTNAYAGFYASSNGQRSWSQLQCSRRYWFALDLYRTNAYGSRYLVDEVGSGALPATSSTPWIQTNPIACVHGNGYQNVTKVWFQDNNGNWAYVGYFTSGAPRALC